MTGKLELLYFVRVTTIDIRDEGLREHLLRADMIKFGRNVILSQAPFRAPYLLVPLSTAAIAPKHR